MTIEEARVQIEELRSRFSQPYPTFDKETITRLYMEVCGKRMRATSCQTCYHDAVIEIYLQLKKNKMANDCKYRLRAGFIINTPAIRGVYSNANLTDDVARKYLELFPQKASMFEKLPEKPVLADAGGTKDIAVGNGMPDRRKRARRVKTGK